MCTANDGYKVLQKNAPLLGSIVSPPSLCPLPKSLAKFVGVNPGVKPGVMPVLKLTDDDLAASPWVRGLGVRGERNIPGESLVGG